MKPPPKVPNMILAGLTPEQRMKRLVELAKQKPPFKNVDFEALNDELSQQEKVIVNLAMAIGGVVAIIESRANRSEQGPSNELACGLATWLESVAVWFAKCETLTLEEFAWICVQGDPRKPRPFLVNTKIRERDEILAQLHRCVGASLHSLPPAGAILRERFRVSELVEVVAAGRCGPIATLNIRALTQYCQTNVKSIAAYSGSVATDGAKVGKRFRPRHANSKWREVLLTVLTAIEGGARKSGYSFTRKSLPESVKLFMPLLKSACQTEDALPPGNADTVRRTINELGWGFSGPGSKRTTGELRRLALAGGLVLSSDRK